MKHKKPKGSKKKQKGLAKNAAVLNKKSASIDQLVEAGEAAAAAEEIEKALEYFLQAESLLKQMCSNTSPEFSAQKLVYVLEKLGESKATLGDYEAAKQHFDQAIQLWTTSPAAKGSEQEKAVVYHETLAGLHLYIGQLSSDQEALEAYKKGLKSLEVAVEWRQAKYTELKTAAASGAAEHETMEDTVVEVEKSRVDEAKAFLEEARQNLASARATIAELYLTDLCFEENAESECDAYVCLALKINETDGEPMVDALQTASSFRLSQKRKAEATGFILRAYKKMSAGCEALAQLVGLDDGKAKRSAELAEVDAASNLPSFEFRCQTVKLLLECAAPDAEEVNTDNMPAWKNAEQERIKCYKASVHVLGSLMAENDEVPEVWYLLGCTYMGSGNKELARHYFTNALEMLNNLQQEMEKVSEESDMQDDEEIDMQTQSMACQMEDIRSKLEELEGDETAMKE